MVGISRYGQGQASSASGDILVSSTDAFDFLASGKRLYDAIYVQARPGVTEPTLAANVARAVGDQYQVRTGDALRTEAAGNAAQVVDFLSTALESFAWVALAVGVLIIYNTFAIVVAQRVREFALLRAVGARGSQVRRAVILEALVVGLVASAIGMLVGIGLFELLVAVVPVLKNLTGSGGVGLRIHPTTVTEVLVVGTLVTVVSAVIPAFRAARTKPIAALRVAAVDRSGTSKARGIIGLIIIGLGAVILLVGMAVKQGLLIGFGPRAAVRGDPGGRTRAGPRLQLGGRPGARPAGHVVAPGRGQRQAEPQPHRQHRQRAGHRHVPGGVRDRRRRGHPRLGGQGGLAVLHRRPQRACPRRAPASSHALQTKVQAASGVRSSVALYDDIGQAGSFSIPSSQGVGAVGAASPTGWPPATSQRCPRS